MAHKTFSQKPADVSRRWILIDASQAPLGRTAILGGQIQANLHATPRWG